MSQVLKYLLLFFLFLLLIWFDSYNQQISADNLNLEFGDSGRYIENIIILEISDSEYKVLQSTTGSKVNIGTRRIIINGDTSEPKEISTRGQSTLMFKRKSLSFQLKSEALFRHGNRTEQLKRFSLLNLSMDKYYCRNRLSFEMMEEVGIFDLFYSFCELQINGRSEGIFMIIERPEDWALRNKNSPLVIRRGYDHRIEKIKAHQKTEQTDTKKYLSYFRKIYRSLNEYKGEELYATLSQWIDMESYMKWLAFNFLVHNGDYSDEVFFYIDPEIKKYRIIPWDYDDIFAIAPHEGREQSKKTIGDKLLFSSEDLLDEKIATDPYLYEVYLKGLKEVLEKLSPVFLKQVFENTYAELYPFYSNKEIISNSEFDYYKNANIDNLKDYMLTIYMGVKVSRGQYLQYLESSDD
jgi:spore coat protein H